ncbi:PKD domain-containing protein [bacterium]|nr:PKD domain-containing protein [bacterium]
MYKVWEERSGMKGLLTVLLLGLLLAASCGGGGSTAVDAANTSSPVAVLTANPGSSGAAPFRVSFNAASSRSSNGTIARYDWDTNGDGSFEVSDGSATLDWTYQDGGSYKASVKVTDTGGRSATATMSISVSGGTTGGNTGGNTTGGNANQNAAGSPNPPTARLTASPRTGPAPLKVTLDASESFDSDGSIVGYEFDRDGDGSYDWKGNSPTVQFTYPDVGDYTVKVRVEDNGGNKSVASMQVSALKASEPGPVTGPNPGSATTPVASLTVTPATSGEIPFSVKFDASGSTDPDGTIETYEFDPDGDGTYDYSGPSAKYDYTYSTAGNYEARARVIDNDGNSSLLTVIMHALAPGQTGEETQVAPTLRLTVRPGTTGPAPFEVEFDASASDDEDGTITKFQFDTDGDGSYEANGTASKFTYTYENPGDYTARVRATDNDGNTAEVSVMITVELPFDPNNEPPIARLELDPAFNGNAPFAVRLDGSSSEDPDGSIVKYEFDANGDGVVDYSGPNSSYDYTYASAGQYDAWMRVTDNGNRSSIATVSVVISGNTGDPNDPNDPNDPPDDGNYDPIAVMFVDPVFGKAPLTVEFDAGPSLDIDGTVVKYKWEIDGKGPFPQGPLGDPKVVTVTFDTPGNYWAKLTVTDDEGGTGSLSMLVIVQ